MNQIPVVECQNVKKIFTDSKNSNTAVDVSSLKIYKGQCYGLVGESGCGKSTLSSIICNLMEPTEGKILFNGKCLSDYSKNELKDFRKKCQIIFQDPYSSLNPKMKIGSIIEEPLIIHKIGTKDERKRLVNEIRTLTGLPPETLEKYPSQLSGGQRQRVAIASAMILNPEFVICDESVSALDVLIQAQILNLLKSMQKSMDLTYLFISHNLNVVSYMADIIGVMYKGKIVEEKPVQQLLENPQHPYTIKLLQAAGLHN